MRPAIALIEFDSIAAGIEAGDAMVKQAPIASMYAGTIHPGKYVVLVGGDTASVEESRRTGLDVGGEAVVYEILLTDVHPAVVDALTGVRLKAKGEAVGVVETRTVASAVAAADAGVKAANVQLLELRLGDELGGKGYVVFGGRVAETETAVVAGQGQVPDEQLVRTVVIPQIHGDLRSNLEEDPGFGPRARSHQEPAE